MIKTIFNAFSFLLNLNTETEYIKLATIGKYPSSPLLLKIIPKTTPSNISTHSINLLFTFFIAARFLNIAMTL